MERFTSSDLPEVKWREPTDDEKDLIRLYSAVYGSQEVIVFDQFDPPKVYLKREIPETEHARTSLTKELAFIFFFLLGVVSSIGFMLEGVLYLLQQFGGK